VTALCVKYRVPGCNFNSVIMDMKLGRKANRGRKPKRKQALVREHVALENEVPVDTPKPNNIEGISIIYLTLMT